MSIYYNCRLRDCVFDFSERKDIIELLTIIKNDDKKDMGELSTELQELPNPFCIGTNNFMEDIKYNIDLSDVHNVKLDLCFGNKNSDDSMTLILHLLGRYLKSGDSIWYNENSLIYFDMKKLNELKVDEMGLLIEPEEVELPDSDELIEQDIDRLFKIYKDDVYIEELILYENLTTYENIVKYYKS